MTTVGTLDKSDRPISVYGVQDTCGTFIDVSGLETFSGQPVQGQLENPHRHGHEVDSQAGPVIVPGMHGLILKSNLLMEGGQNEDHLRCSFFPGCVS